MSDLFDATTMPYKAHIPKGLKDQPMYRWSGSAMASKDNSILLKRHVE